MPPIGISPVERIELVALYRREKGFRFETHNPSGHTLQLTAGGSAYNECSGREYVVKRGTLLWAHDSELVRGHVVHPPWVFYSVNFIAPTFPPPEFEARSCAVGQDILDKFKALHAVWNDVAVPVGLRTLRTHAALLDLLANLTPTPQHQIHVNPKARLWWDLETELRRDLRRPISLALMTQLTGCSQATIARSCQAAVGMPPLKRLKLLRMSMARGLVWSSDLSMTRIAERVGYARVHEFSRDFRKQFGRSPSYDRGHSDYDALRGEIARGYGHRYGVPRPGSQKS